MLDTSIRGGTTVDSTGAAPYIGDIRARGGESFVLMAPHWSSFSARTTRSQTTDSNLGAIEGFELYLAEGGADVGR